MANTILIFTEEGVKRVLSGLGELPSKVAHELLNDVESQLKLLKEDAKRYVALVEEHLAPHKVVTEVKAEVSAVAADVKAAT